MKADASEWVTLRIELPLEIAEAVASFLHDAGAPAVLLDDRAVDAAPVTTGRTRLEAPVATAGRAHLEAALTRYLESLAVIEPAAGQATVTTVPVPAVDWVALARTHHRPLPIGRRLLVAPPWDVPAAPGREVLVIEPGMAFGTGQHATTRSCLEAIEAALDDGPVRSAIDVGTGSGILALSLARLGVPDVVALDVDPSVLPLARTTLDRNRAAGVRLLAGTAAAVRRPAELVVANLFAGTIVAESAALAAATAPRGRLILSGILIEQAAAVAGAFPGWRCAAARDAEGWRTLTLERDVER